jgi:protein-S-isoprenylcysteine O-methyltransferase Ste14
MAWYEAVGLVSLVFLAFALLHSLCVASFVKGLMGRLLGETFLKAFYRLIYTAFSAATTLLALYLILGIPDVMLFSAPSWLRWAMRAIQLGGLALGLWSFNAVHPLEFLGLAQAWRYIRHGQVGGDLEGITRDRLVRTGAYARLRHPLYLAGMMIFTFQPDITRSWLVVAALADAYFIFGALVEERRLIRRFGEEYRAYMREVPRFIPRASRRGS